MKWVCLLSKPNNSYLTQQHPTKLGPLGATHEMGSELYHNGFWGGGKRTRTADICLAKAALYQLSYTPWAILDSNQGPHPYQGCALTN